MAQTEDTELRDLVIEALEKNGSLAKIRALLRANIFLAFEEECEKVNQNMVLDSLLKRPDGVLSLSIVHEFLEFCNLKNTLFVYMAESRQGQDYKYEGSKSLQDKVKHIKHDCIKEPILLTLLKKILNPYLAYFDQSNHDNKHRKSNNSQDNQNSTYIVHEDSSSSITHSQSDNSSDEKNKLHLRLQLDNSDTDTSSDSIREKSCSEYIANEHILNESTRLKNKQNISVKVSNSDIQNHNAVEDANAIARFVHDLQVTNSSDSTSYVELKPYNMDEEKLINTTGLPLTEVEENAVSTAVILQPLTDPQVNINQHKETTPANPYDSVSPTAAVKNVPTLLTKIDVNDKNLLPNILLEQENEKADSNATEYSCDFSSSPVKELDNGMNIILSPDSQKSTKCHQNITVESPHQHSLSSRSSISISDVADLLENSEKNSYYESYKDTKEVKNKDDKNKSRNYESGDYSESSVPSISNLSFDVHSD